MLTSALTVLHIAICFFLIVVVLLQKGKGQDFASTFGGGGTQTAFGARSGATILHRMTTVAAVMFMITSLTLTIMMSQPGQGSVLEEDMPVESAEPVVPELPETLDDLTLPEPVAEPDAPTEEGGAGVAVPDEEAEPDE